MLPALNTLLALALCHGAESASSSQEPPSWDGPAPTEPPPPSPGPSSSSPDGCCLVKMISGLGDKSGTYFLTEWDGELPSACKDACVYMRESGPGHFCFKPSPNYNSQCSGKLGSTINITWEYGMTPFVGCVQPGDTILFEYPDQVHNVNEVSEEEYNTCSSNVWNTNPTSGNYSRTFSERDVGKIYYFACGVHDGHHCNSGNMTAKITVKAACPSTAAGDLLTLQPDNDTSAIPGCQDDTALSCRIVSLDMKALEGNQLILPGGVNVSRMDHPLENGVTFANPDGCTATFSQMDGEVYGMLEMQNHTLTLEPCSSMFTGCHILKEKDMQMMNVLSGNESDVMGSEWNQTHTEAESRARVALLKQGSQDTTTLILYSVKVYYTPQAAASTGNIFLFIEHMINEINLGYMNSRIPLRVTLSCIEEANIIENRDAFTNFQAHKSSVGAELRQSADAAMLLVSKLYNPDTGNNVCGLGERPGTVSAAQMSCALGHFSSGHELAHNFGASHDSRSKPLHPSLKSYGLGAHFGPYRSVMAYSPGQRVNYYSSPHVFYQGFRTGTAGEDNARLLTENRFAFAAQGDESDRRCKPGCFSSAGYIAGGGNLKSASGASVCQGCRTKGPGDCANRCARTRGCVGWTMVAGPWCWLKASISSTSGPVSEWAWGYPCGRAVCCRILKVTGHWFSGTYQRTAVEHNGLKVYKHLQRDWCIFWGGHWKIEVCGWIRHSDNSQGIGFSKVNALCPEAIGAQWRYYKWGVGGFTGINGPTSQGPVDTGITVTCG